MNESPLPLDAKNAQQQRDRLAEMVAHARAHSPFYRELYRDLPERVEDPTLLPVTTKKTLMARFDDWVTDREVTLEKVRAFIAKPELVGEKFLGKHLVATTSGNHRHAGIFVLDERQHSAGWAGMRRVFGQLLTFWDWVRMLGRGMRIH